jgi:hypothetical protein
MIGKLIRTCSLAMAVCVLAGPTFLFAAGEEDNEVICQDYGGWPEVGGRKVCVFSTGMVCTYTSVQNGVTTSCN